MKKLLLAFLLLIAPAVFGVGIENGPYDAGAARKDLNNVSGAVELTLSEKVKAAWAEITGNIYASGTATIDGEVYIGGAADAGDFKLQVAGDSIFTGNTYPLTLARDSSTVSTNCWLQFNLLNSSASSRAYGAISTMITDSTAGTIDGDMRFLTTGNNSLTERARITSAGNVLIGTTTDDTANKLQVNGGVKINDFIVSSTDGDSTYLKTNSTVDGSDDRRLTLTSADTSSTTRGAYFNLFGNEHATNPGNLSMLAGNSGTGFISFYTGNTVERARITSAGNVLIGTTTDDSVNKLQVAGDISQPNGTTARYGHIKIGTSALANNAVLSTGLYSGTYTPCGNFAVVSGSSALPLLATIVGNAITKQTGSSASWSVVKDNAGTMNIYVDGGEVKIQNKTGASKSIYGGFTGQITY